MDQAKKDKLKKSLKVAGGLSGAATIGYGIGIEKIMADQIMSALTEGDVKKGLFFGAFFLLIWLEVRRMNREIQGINKSVSAGFAAGEARFQEHDKEISGILFRLTMLERFKKELEAILNINRKQVSKEMGHEDTSINSEGNRS